VKDWHEEALQERAHHQPQIYVTAHFKRKNVNYAYQERKLDIISFHLKKKKKKSPMTHIRKNPREVAQFPKM
jgi:hypothetical protein